MGNIKTDIQQIFNVLNQEKLCSGHYKNINNNICSIEKLKLNINDVPRGTKPNVKMLCVILTINFHFDKNGISPDEYNFCFEVSAYNGEKKHKASWHFDYDTTSTSDYIHPYFHLTYGGNLMNDIDLGETVLVPTPRIAYMPMDFVLGIDFILSNFMNVDRYNHILENKEYTAAVKNSQERLWKPYILTIANHWDKRINLSSHYFKSTELIPTLL